MVQSTSTSWGYAQRMKRVRSDQKVQTQLDLYKERLPLYSCHNCVCGDAANRSASSPCLLDSLALELPSKL